jgi:uncharacterized damage-inducible protein DinB
LVEGLIPGVLFGEENPVADWQKYFGENTEAQSSPEAYPPFAEVRAKYKELREKNLQLLESLTDDQLDTATKAPPKGREREFATFGSSFLVLAMHQAMHRGHVTDAQRAAGRAA